LNRAGSSRSTWVPLTKNPWIIRISVSWWPRRFPGENWREGSSSVERESHGDCCQQVSAGEAALANDCTLPVAAGSTMMRMSWSSEGASSDGKWPWRCQGWLNTPFAAAGTSGESIRSRRLVDFGSLLFFKVYVASGYVPGFVQLRIRWS